MGWSGEVGEDHAALLGAIVDAIPELFFVMDRDGRYLAVLGGLDDARYHDGRSLVGKSMQDVLDADTAEMFLGWIREALDTQRVVHCEYELGSDDVAGVERRAGVPDHLFFEGHIAPVAHGDGPPELVVWVVFNVTETRLALRELEAQREVMEQQRTELERLVSIDHLTEVLNRRSFFAEVERERRWVVRSGSAASVVMFDLDHFKSINDTWGHAAGDEVLREVSRRVRVDQRGSDVVGRLGGEEFAVLLRGVGLDHAAVAAERIRAAIADLRVDHDGRSLSVTASVGVAEIRPEDGLPDDAIKRADAAMYAAKRDGKDRVVVEPS